MTTIMIILTGTLMGAFFFASYRFGVKEGEKHTQDKPDVVIDDRTKHERIREYKKFSEYHG